MAVRGGKPADVGVADWVRGAYARPTTISAAAAHWIA
jgi:hypothetical protein